MQSASGNPRRLPSPGRVAIAAALAVAGCSRLPQAAYTLRADAENLDLPARHQRQVAAYLTMFHGTPAHPRMAAPDPEAVEQAAEAVSAEAPASDDDPGVFKIASREERSGYDPLRLELGRQVYTNQCAGCHGTTGDGQGPAAAHLDPPPRDYRKGIFKFTSTPLGSKPRREDLRRILRYGAKGTSMPAFRFLPEEELEAVIDYVQALASRGQLELALLAEAEQLDEEENLDPETVAESVTDIADAWQRAEDELVRPLTVNPPRTAETIAAGAVAFADLYCYKCHGPDARGSKSKLADVGKDAWGRTAYPANLSMGMLHGGRRPIDIYRRIYSGINGTPMPSSQTPDSAAGETPQQRSERIWHLVHFVTAIIEENEVPPDCRRLIDDAMQRQSQPAAPDGAAGTEKAAAARSPEIGDLTALEVVP